MVDYSMQQLPQVRGKITLGHTQSSLNPGLHKPTVLHDGNPCSVRLKKDSIIVGCSEISLDVVSFLMAEHEKRFSKEAEHTLQ